MGNRHTRKRAEPRSPEHPPQASVCGDENRATRGLQVKQELGELLGFVLDKHSGFWIEIPPRALFIGISELRKRSGKGGVVGLPKIQRRDCESLTLQVLSELTFRLVW